LCGLLWPKFSTKKDTFSFLRIDEFLDQVGQLHYLLTLDLTSGYWQIAMHSDSQEKTSIIHHPQWIVQVPNYAISLVQCTIYVILEVDGQGSYRVI